MFILYSVCNSLESWSVSHLSIYEDCEIKVFKNIKYLEEISNNWLNDLFVTNVYKILD